MKNPHYDTGFTPHTKTHAPHKCSSDAIIVDMIVFCKGSLPFCESV